MGRASGALATRRGAPLRAAPNAGARVAPVGRGLVPWRRSGFLVAALLVLAAPLFAQDTTVEVNVNPREVAANGQVQVEIVVRGPDAGNAVLASQPPGEKLIPGGGVSQSSSFQIINGAMSSSKTFSMVYLPSGLGQASVPSFVIRVGATEHRTKPVTVTITKAAKGGAGAPGVAGGQDNRGDIQIEVLADLDRSRIYQGETVTLQYRLLFRSQVRGIVSPQGLEPIPNFVVEDLPVDRQVSRTERGGAPWNQALLFKRRLTPTQSGKLTIKAVPFTFEVLDPRDRFGFFSTTVPVQRTSNALTLDVRPLPEAGRPADFSGAVGSFTLTATLDRTELAAGDAAALKVTVKGDGSLGSATAPAVPEVTDLRMFDPEVQDVARGHKAWTYPIVPQTAGRIVVPAIHWSFFDPRAGAYRTVQSQPPAMNVTPGKGTPMTSGVAPAGREIKALGSDLRFIKPAPMALRDRRQDLYRRPWYWLLVGLPCVALPGLWLAGWSRERLDSSGLSRRRGALPQARRRLKLARETLVKGDPPQAQRLAAEAVARYVADRTRRSHQGLTYESLAGLALQGGASEETVTSLRQVAEGFDRLLYTPGGDSAEETARLIEGADQAIGRLEREWRR